MRHARFAVACTLILAGVAVGDGEARSPKSTRRVKPAALGRAGATTTAKAWNPEQIVAALALTRVQAWRRPDGATRYAITVTNTAPKAYQTSNGQAVIQRYKLVGSRWSVAGGHAIPGLAPGKAYELKDLPFSGEGATQFKVSVLFKSRTFATKTVPIGAEPDEFGTPLEKAARRILGAVTYDPFTAHTDVTGRAAFDLVIHNNTDEAYTPAMGRITLHTYQGEGQGWIPAGYHGFDAIPARGTKAFRNVSFVDRGGNYFKVYLNQNKTAWQPKVVPIAGAKERDARAEEIARSLVIESLKARRLDGNLAEFRIVVRNNSTYAFSRLGLLVIQTSGLVGSAWRPTGGWSIDTVPAKGTAQKTQKYAHKNATKLKVILRWKQLTLGEKVVPIQ